MSNNVVFEDYSVQIKNLIHDKAIQFLEEAGMEIVSMTVRNAVRDTGQTAGSYDHKVVESDLAVHIGSNYENAIWEEFGTGEFAEKGDGRKGWWVYVKGSSGGGKTKGGKVYTEAQARRAVRFLREKGLDAHMTKGKKARHPFKHAYDASKSRIIKRAEQIFGEL